MSSSSALGASKKKSTVKGPAKKQAVELSSEKHNGGVSKSSAPSKKGDAQDSKRLAKAAGKVKSATETTASGKEAETRDDDDDEDEGALKSEVQGFLDGFNYDTDSDISEPEGLDEIDDG